MKRTALLVIFAFAISASFPALAQDIFFRHDKNGWEKGFQALAEGIKAASGISPIVQLQSPPDQYQGFIQTSVAGGHPPAFFTWWNGKLLESLAATGKIADLSAVWDKAVAAGFFTEEDKEQVSVNGVPYAIPLNVARYPVLYRKDAFQKAGIAHPPKTWEELIEAAEKLKAAGYVPFVAPDGGTWGCYVWFSELMIRTDPNAFIGLGKGTTPYNGPEVKRAFDIWTDFFKKGYFTDPREPDGSRPFTSGQAAMWLMGEWTAGGLERLGMTPGKDFGAFILPRVNPEVEDSIIVEMAILVVSKEALTKHPTLTAAVDYLLSPAAGTVMATAPGTRVFNGNRKIAPPDPIVAEVNDLMAAQHPRAIMRWWEAGPPEIQSDLISQIGAFVLSPTAETAKRVMNNMQSLNAEYWADNR